MARGISIDIAHDDPKRIIRQRCDAVELTQIAIDEITTFEEIARRVSHRRQLTEDDEIGPEGASLGHGITHQCEIGVEGADGVVELGDGDSHR